MDNETVLEEIANLGECTCPRLYKIVDTKELGKGISCKKHGFILVDRMSTSMLGPQELEVSLNIRMIPSA